MKTNQNAINNVIPETLTRFLFSFQLIIVGLLIPFLFMIGINNDSGEHAQHSQVKTEKSVVVKKRSAAQSISNLSNKNS